MKRRPPRPGARVLTQLPSVGAVGRLCLRAAGDVRRAVPVTTIVLRLVDAAGQSTPQVTPTVLRLIKLVPVPNAIDFSDKKVLIADDVADTGKTLKLVRDFCIDHVAEVRSAVIHEKSHSLAKCEYVWKKTDRWINFPWSVEKSVVRRTGQVLDA
ncbi:phosphoribosyltransferase [Streptomyces sp. NPDC057963]|uniref:phosphoribosyltransferase n=1 Tax=Streptomyces sp. NPDC057963 TaxID=3346290 RepID=UPI0036EDA75D